MIIYIYIHTVHMHYYKWYSEWNLLRIGVPQLSSADLGRSWPPPLRSCWSRSQMFPERIATVDGRNPAPPWKVKTLKKSGMFTMYQLVQDFWTCKTVCGWNMVKPPPWSNGMSRLFLDKSVRSTDFRLGNLSGQFFRQGNRLKQVGVAETICLPSMSKSFLRLQGKIPPQSEPFVPCLVCSDRVQFVQRSPFLVDDIWNSPNAVRCWLIEDLNIFKRFKMT